MKQKRLVDAYNVFQKLSDIPMEISISYNIMKIKKKLEDHYNFQLQEEKKYFDEYHGKITDDGKFMRFPSSQEKKDFNIKLDELNNMEVDIEITPFDLSLSENFKLTANEIEAINEFVHFV